MTTTPATPAPRRHIWRWVALGLGLCLAPFMILAAVAYSYLSLNSDATVLRKHVMASTDARWHTKVQMSIGGLTLDAIRFGLCFAHDKNISEARQALAAIRHASVGVYERAANDGDCSRAQLFADTDRAMQRRGWTRLVGVADHNDTVLVYMPADFDADGPIEICLAVINARELVVVSTSVNAVQLGELVAAHAKGEGKMHLQLAKFGF